MTEVQKGILTITLATVIAVFVYMQVGDIV